ncbi:hypothetical protein PORCRE_1103 [Porphyromonas crevioricanis JCM 15906]|uniref:Uncharacterized protein n=1 Tax=Porphyromonas crevioricanis JCM 15906 TaxID=1305617 RepID=T1CNJ4_9PORP|nr:hypothetical protein PORCRE_1103 [Porphyromonas crevioricanis JCM 15906]
MGVLVETLIFYGSINVEAYRITLLILLILITVFTIYCTIIFFSKLCNALACSFFRRISLFFCVHSTVVFFLICFT